MAYISKIQLKGENDVVALYDIRDKEAISVTKNIIYVTNFGATGDGVTDDTESIQNCINNNPHTTIIFPKGNYKIMAPLEIYEDNDSQVDLYFESGSRLFAGSAINALIEIGKVKENVTSHWTRYKLGDIVTISGSGILDATNCDKAIYIVSNRHFNRLINLNIVNCNSYGIFIDKPTLSGVTNSADSQFLNLNLTGSGNANANTIGICTQSNDNEFNNIKLQRFVTGFQLNGNGNIIDNVHLTQGFVNGGNIASNFNKSIGFEFLKSGFDMLSNIYVDTYGKPFVFNAEDKYTVLTNIYTYYYFNTADSITSIFTLLKKCRLDVTNSRFTLTNLGTNKIVDLSNITDNNFRRNFIAYDYLHFKNCTSYHAVISKKYDPFNCMQIRDVSSETIITIPYSAYMEANKYYPVAMLRNGVYNFNLSMENSEVIGLVIRIPTSGTPTLEVSNISSQGDHKNDWSVSLCEGELDDNQRYVYLCVSSTKRLHYNPTIFGIEKNFLNEVFSYPHFNSDNALENPTILVEKKFHTA